MFKALASKLFLKIFSESLWEQTHNTDIERYYKRCDANNCICPGGRTYSKYKWIIQSCCYCGRNGLHKLCRPKSQRDKIIICDICYKVHRSHSGEPEIATTSLTNENLRKNLEETEMADDEDDVVMIDEIDLTQEDEDEPSSASPVVSETLEDKRKRKEAVRPIRIEMKDFRINLWFMEIKSCMTLSNVKSKFNC